MTKAINRTCDGLAQIASIISISVLLTAAGIAADSPRSYQDKQPDANSSQLPICKPFRTDSGLPSYRPNPASHAGPIKHVGCVPTPGHGPGESVVFPSNAFPIIYKDKNGELGLTLPMSEGVWGTGDWFGLRHTLVDAGVDFTGGYNSNILANVAGGKRRGAAYADQIWLEANLDLEKLVGWKGGHFVASIIDRNGQQMSQLYTGNLFNPNQIWGQESFALYHFYLQQTLLNGWIDIKAGRMGVTDDFFSSPLYGLYVNNGIDGQPNAICSSGWLTAWPYATWGGRIKVEDKEDHLYGMAGVYQITNRQYAPSYHGVDFSIRPYDGVAVIGEVGWTPEFQPHPQTNCLLDKSTDPASSDDVWHGMPGHYKFGGYYTFWNDIPTFDNKSASGTWGVYCGFDQMVYQAKPGSECGLTLWGAVLLAPDQRTAKIPYSFYAGTIYTGLIPGRSHDNMALTIVYGSISDTFAHSPGVPIAPDGERGIPTYETVLEACYTFQLSKFWRVQPDVQYIINPGGTGHIPNALVIGAQIGFNF